MTKRNKIYCVVGFVLFSASLVLVFLAGREMSFSDQSKYIDNARDISAIIFGVCGAWLALSYPKALSLAAAAQVGDVDARRSALEKAIFESGVLIAFVETMAVSIIIISVGLALPYVKAILAYFSIFQTYVSYLRGLSFSLIYALAVLQFVLLLVTLKVTVQSLRDIRQELGRARFADDIHKDQSY